MLDVLLKWKASTESQLKVCRGVPHHPVIFISIYMYITHIYMLLFPFDVNSLRVHLKRRCSWLSTIRMRKLPRTCSQTLYCLFRHHFVVIVSASFRHCFVIISSSFCRCFGIISSLFCHHCVRTIACYHLDQDIGQRWRQHKRSRHQWLQVTYASCSLIIIATTTTATTTVITTTIATTSPPQPPPPPPPRQFFLLAHNLDLLR